MTLFSNALIDQQMYTREKSGIFRSTEGYDTIAKSSGLDNSFIKKYIHPLCVYDAPAELLAKGEKEDALFPSALQLVRLETGDMVLGNSHYVNADFTGLRSTFFSHNYIIPAVRAEEWVHQYHTWLQADFQEQYNVDQGQDLPQLQDIPSTSAAFNRIALLEQLGIDGAAFRQLIGAVMSAIHKRRKVYISLNVPISELSIYAKQLTAVITEALPYAFRRRLGFTTYAKEPESRKGMQLMFVESGSIRAGDRNIERDYHFDWSTGRIHPAQPEKAGQVYTEWVWEHLAQPDQLRALQEFADSGQAGRDASTEELPDPAQYDEWTTLFRVEAGDEQLYSEHPASILQSLLKHLRPAGALDSAIRVNDLFLSRFDREFDEVRTGAVPDIAIAECFAEYYGIDEVHTGRKIVEYFIWATRNAVAAGQTAASQALYMMMEKHPALNEAFIHMAGSQPTLAVMLLNPLIERKFHQAQTVEEVIHLAVEWGTTYPQLLEMDDYCNRAGQSFMEALRHSADLMIATGTVFTLLDEVDTGSLNGKTIQPEAWIQSGLGDDMRASAERLLLNDLEWSSLTREKLLTADFLSLPLPSDEYPERAERRLNAKKLALQLLYIWFTEKELSAELMNLLHQLQPNEKDQVQQLGRLWLAEDIRKGQFGRLAAAFSYSAEPNDLDYSAMVEAVRQHASSPEQIYPFFHWSEGRVEFMRPDPHHSQPSTSDNRLTKDRAKTTDTNKKTSSRQSKHPQFVPAYETAILAYFRRHDPEAFRKGTLAAQAKADFANEGPALRSVYVKARDELATPLSKWFKRNRKRMPLLALLAVVLLVAIGGLSFYGLKVFGVITVDQTTPVVEPTPEVVEPPTETVQLPKVVVTLQTPNASTSTTSTTSTDSNATGLAFHFADRATCEAFAPTKATLMMGNGQKVDYTQLNAKSICKAPTSSGSDTSSEPSTNDSTATSDDDTASTVDSDDNSTVTMVSTTTNNTNNGTKTSESTSGSGTTDPTDSTDTDATTETGTTDSSTSSTTPTEEAEPVSQAQLSESNPYTVTIDLPAKTDSHNINKIKIDSTEYVITSIMDDSATTETP